jgi:hypothetical protein
MKKQNEDELPKTWRAALSKQKHMSRTRRDRMELAEQVTPEQFAKNILRTKPTRLQLLHHLARHTTTLMDEDELFWKKKRARIVRTILQEELNRREGKK